MLAVAQLGDLGWPVDSITERTLRQKIVPNHLLGRVNSAMHLLFHGLIPLGALAGGAAGFLLSTICLLGAPVRMVD